jgi:hypothetical protein
LSLFLSHAPHLIVLSNSLSLLHPFFRLSFSLLPSPFFLLHHVKDWSNKRFTVLNHHDIPGLYILGPLDDVSSLLEESRVTLQVMRTSDFLEDIQVTYVMLSSVERECFLTLLSLFCNSA